MLDRGFLPAYHADMCGIRLASIWIVIALVMAGCAQTMSLEEARKVAVAMDEKALNAPPRHVNDILDVLKQPGRFDAQATGQMKAQAAALPPTGADDQALALFYQKRGEAAWQLGYMKQALADLRLSLSYFEKIGQTSPNLMTSLAAVENIAGNFKDAIALYEESLALRDSLGAYDHLVDAYIQMGDLETAEKISREGLDFFERKTAVTSKRASQKKRAVRKQPQREIKTRIREVHWNRIQYAVLEAKGKHQEAETYLRRELELHHAGLVKERIPRFAIMNRLFLSLNLMRQGRLLEAEVEARQAITESLGHGGVESEQTARAVEYLARVMMAQERLDDAERLTRAGIRILETAGIPSDSNTMCFARMSLGDILSRKRQFVQALEQYDLAREGMVNNRYLYETKFVRNRGLMITLLKTGRTDEALPILSRLYDASVQSLGGNHIETMRLLGVRAMANAGKGDDRAAFHDYSTAIPVLIGQDQQGSDTVNRFTRIIVESYIDFLGRIHGTPMERDLKIEAPVEAFRLISYLGGLTTQTALGESSARAAAAYDADLSDLVRKEQDMSKQVTALQGIFSNALMTPRDQQDPQALKTLKDSIDTLTRARAALLDEIRRRFPRYADFTRPRAVSIPDLRGRLYPDETLISVFTTEAHTHVWAIPHSGTAQFLTVNLGRKELAGMVAKIRASVDADPATFGDIPPFDVALAHELYAKLLKPLESAWKDSRGLLIAVHGPLDQLPFSLLPTAPRHPAEDKSGSLFSHYREVPWLIRQAMIVTLPSINALVTLRSLPEGNPQRRAFAGFGDPIFNREQLATAENLSGGASVRPESAPVVLASRGTKVHRRGIRIAAKSSLDNAAVDTLKLDNLDRLPDTAEEIKSIGRVLNADPGRDLFLGKDCSKEKIRTTPLDDRKVIAFATHALVPGDLDGLDQPALALSSSTVTGHPGDGLLTMAEILKLKLNADWVILSACNTGAAEGQGAQAVSGLGKAFFYAGTRALLVTMWPVETTSARKLVTGIFQAQEADRTLSRAQALRKSMLDLIDRETLIDPVTGKVAVAYAHPLFWAPFIAVGDPGRMAGGR